MLAVAREHELDDPEDIPDGTDRDETLSCYDDVLGAIREEYGLDPGRDETGAYDAESGGTDAEEYDDDPRDAEVVLDAQRAWDAAKRTDTEEVEGVEEVTGDVVRDTALSLGLIDNPEEKLEDGAYTKAYNAARERGAPLPKYLTHADTIENGHEAIGATYELGFFDLDEDALNVEVTGTGDDVTGNAVRTLDPSPLDGWRDSESGESVLVYPNGTVWDADLGEDGRVVDIMRFVAVDAGITDDPVGVLEGAEFCEAYDTAREEYGAPLPRWESGTAEATPVLPPAEELVEGVEDVREEIDKLRTETEKLYRETARNGGGVVNVLRCLPGLGKTTAAIKTAGTEPTAYFAPRKELMHDAEEKADEFGVTAAHAPVFSSATVDPDLLDGAVERIREDGKEALRDPWAFFEEVNAADGVFIEPEDDEITLDRPTCPTAEGEHGDAWALAVHVARKLDYTPRDIHERAEAIFGRPLPCQHEGDCAYSEGWDTLSEPETCPDLLIGHYTHAHVETARTYYEHDDDGKERSARVLALDEFPGLSYAESFDDDAVEHALWLAGALREGVDDRQDLIEADLWGDEWVRAWLTGEVEAGEDKDPRVRNAAHAATTLDVLADLAEAAEDADEILDAGEELLEDYDLAEDIREFVMFPFDVAGEDAAALASRITEAEEEIPAEHGGRKVLSWLNDTVGAGLARAATAGSYDVDVEDLPVAGELREFVRKATETESAGLLRSASRALLGGDTGARELAVWAEDGHAHRKANLLLEAAVRPESGDETARIGTDNYEPHAYHDGGVRGDGTQVKKVEVGGKQTVLWDRNHNGAEILTPPTWKDGGGGDCPVVGLDATARKKLWRECLGEGVRLRDIHESPAERAEALREVHGLQVVQTSDRVKSYEGDPSGKNLDADVALLEEIHDKFTGVRAPRSRDEDVATVDKPAVITTKCVRDALESDTRLDGVVGEWENYGNVKGSNDLGDVNLAALLGSQHYGDAAVERFAAFAGEEIEHMGHGGALEYGGDVADEYLAHMRKDQVMQAVLRFARGEDGGALVFAHTAALLDDLPVVGKGEVIKSWSETATAVAEEFRKRPDEELTTGDVAEAVDVTQTHVRRTMNELAEAGYLNRRETGEGRANGYAEVEQPGAGETEINAEVNREGVAKANTGGSNVVYTVDVRVSPVREADLPARSSLGSVLPSPDAREAGLVEGDPPE
jgi:DNA-binding transcriptional ArsR family regulator